MHRVPNQTKELNNLSSPGATIKSVGRQNVNQSHFVRLGRRAQEVKGHIAKEALRPEFRPQNKWEKLDGMVHS